MAMTMGPVGLGRMGSAMRMGFGAHMAPRKDES